MNIFYLDKDPDRAARSMINKHVSKMIVEHVSKMIVESAQLLSTAHRILDGIEGIKLSKNNRRLKTWAHPDPKLDEILYKSSFRNHPSGVWTREESANNYMWLYNHFVALGAEFKRRYKKKHLSITKLTEVLSVPPKNIPNTGFTQPPQAMPDEYKDPDSIIAYHKYYKAEKLKLGTEEDRIRYYEFYGS